jgi:sugar lactone lactonase YvrE
MKPLHAKAAAVLALLTPFLPATAGEMDVFRLRREETYAFAQKPTLLREGDRVSIAFETTTFCDVAVAVEQADGRTVRHVVAGVLGPNAPAPLQKNAKKQVVVWDGKNDAGEYVDDKDACLIRVSLGLKPQYEKPLYWSPYKPWGRKQPVVAPAPEGVYVYEGDNVDSVKLYDHDGNYLRTVYPFPADKLEQVKGLRWHNAAQDGARVAFKEGFYQATFLTCGFNSGFDPATGYGMTHFPQLAYSWAEDAPDFPAATAFAVRGTRMALAGVLGINRLATDGSSGGMELVGPACSLKVAERLASGGTQERRLSPRSAALSPDGRTLYLTGYCWSDDTRFSNMYGGGLRWMNGVLRVKMDAQDPPALFAGTMKLDEEGGNGPAQLYSPVSVSCDAQGNVYVADAANNRVQVFSPEGTVIESIPTPRPVHVSVNPKNGELFVATWDMRVFAAGWDQKVPPTLTHLGPAGKREVLGTYKLPFLSGVQAGETGYGGLIYRVEVDTYGETPTVWLTAFATFMHGWYDIKTLSGQRGAIKVFTLEQGKLAPKKDFGVEAAKAVTRVDPVTNARQLLTVNPKTGKLYVMESRIASSQALEIDPDTGRTRLLDLPHATDEIAFDMDGHLYLDTGTCLTRFDPADQREVPWDYGEERANVGGGGHGEKAVSCKAALILPGARPLIDEKCFISGFALSPRGMLALHNWNAEGLAVTAGRSEKSVGETGRKYQPKSFPGRQRWGETHVFDRHGTVRYEDAIPGLGFVDGVAIDKDDNLYVLAGAPQTPDGKRCLNPSSATLIKFKPGRGRIVTAGDKRIPVPLKAGEEPREPTQLAGRWVTGAEWLYGGVGFASWEWGSRFALDLYARTFAPETDHYSVAVLDSNGNLITRIGRYGNADDGRPLEGAAAGTRALGGDEVALMHPCYAGMQSDKRLFISDAGNRRIVSVRLRYAAEERLPLKNAPARGSAGQP